MQKAVCGMCDVDQFMNRRPALLKKESGLFDKEETRSREVPGFVREQCILSFISQELAKSGRLNQILTNQERESGRCIKS